MCSQGGFRERATARRRPALKRFGQNFFRQHMSRSRRMARGSRGRQRRVVLAPVAGVKLMEIFEPDRASADRQSVSDGGKRNSSPGRARYKPLKPLRREGRVFRRTLRSPVCILCARSRVLRAPGFPCALLLFGGHRSMQNFGRFAPRECGHTFICHRPRRRTIQYSRDVDD
jgi:hypothetical protein